MPTRQGTSQDRILAYLKSELKTKGYPPTVREICDAVGLRSTATVHDHLQRLEKRGLIRRDPTKPRALEILSEDDDQVQAVYVPLLETVKPGVPLLSPENTAGLYPIPSHFVESGETFFLVRVRGESMVKAGILDGDLVLIRRQSAWANGDLVAALLDESITIKRLFPENNMIRLQPENDSMSPIYVKDVQILGIVAGLIRKY